MTNDKNLIPGQSSELAQPKSFQELLDNADDYASGARAASTQNAFESDWDDFVTWASLPHIQRQTLPADVDTLRAYISAMRDQGLKLSTIRRRLSSISQAHKLHNHPSPTDHALVEKTLMGAAKAQHAQGVRTTKKKPVTTAMIKQWMATLDNSKISYRDKALILIGYAGALRRSELARIQYQDLEFTPDGLIITLRDTKTQKSADDFVGIPRTYTSTCPVAALETWLQVAEIDSGACFRTFYKGGRTIRFNSMSDMAVNRVVKKMVKVLGLDPDQYGGHSLRSGHITEATKRGAPTASTMAHTRHQTERIFRGYMRKEELLTQGNPVNHLGL